MASAGLGASARTTRSTLRSIALLQQAPGADRRRAAYDEATDLLETALAVDPRNRAAPISGSAEVAQAQQLPGKAVQILCRCAEARAERRQRARRPGRGLCPARRRRARPPESRAGADLVPPALPAGDRSSPRVIQRGRPPKSLAAQRPEQGAAPPAPDNCQHDSPPSGFREGPRASCRTPSPARARRILDGQRLRAAFRDRCRAAASASSAPGRLRGSGAASCGAGRRRRR